MATIGIQINTNFAEASAELKQFTSLTSAETNRINNNLKKLEQFEADSFIQKNKRMALSVQATRGATEALAAEHSGLERKIQMLIRNGVDPMDNKLAALRQEYARTGAEMQKHGKSNLDFAQTMAAVAAAVAGAAIFFKKTLEAASNLEEQTNKLLVTFSGLEVQAITAANNLAASYGLSNRAAREMLSTTGDILQGFGLTRKESLLVSEKIQKLSVDLASFKNLQGGAAQASEAITKAMLGERESLKTLGIAILESDVKQRLLAKGQAALTGEALKAAKAQATWELILERSTNAVGDFARTQNSYANQTRILSGNLEDASAMIGQAFLPVVTAVIAGINFLVDVFKSIPSPLRNFIVLIVALVAAFVILNKILVMLGITINVALWKVTLIIAALSLIILAISDWNKFKIFIAAFWDFFVAAAETALAAVLFSLAHLPGIMAQLFTGILQVASAPLRGILALLSKIDPTGVASRAIAGINALVNAPIKGMDALTKNITDKATVYLTNSANKTKTAWQTMQKVTAESVKNTDGTIKNLKKTMGSLSEEALRAAEHFNKAFLHMLDSLKTHTQAMGEITASFNLSRMGAYQLGGQQQIEFQKSLNTLDVEMLMQHLGTKQAMEIADMTQKLIQQKRFADAQKLINAAKNKAMENQDKARMDAVFSGTKQFFSDMSEVAKSSGNKNFALYKAFAIANATIAGIEAAVKAWNVGMEFGPWTAAIFAAASIAKTTAQISEIAKQKPPTAEVGGNFMVPMNPRSSRGDSQTLRVNPGENVSVTPRGEGGGGGAGSLVVNNYLDSRLLYSVMQRGIDSGKITITQDNIVRY